jgi:hypothetical protein
MEVYDGQLSVLDPIIFLLFFDPLTRLKNTPMEREPLTMQYTVRDSTT